ncbi:putative Diaminopimelate decarboxylase [Xenorhabdus bovienii str. oregonense]|uniref:Putative Diaminopimelate decarboxylase n=1 Tax=Xenorhabdus bovienii str. oregonense TaxID=1398202 RepID=A0A077P8N1_XENBV|nr:hypothetical protein [Xenorhabdus bovienii]CDH06958.1 putative Diaminopimelate decarboxylase [Xenorhabdus bovienii str. oregonense]
MSKQYTIFNQQSDAPQFWLSQRDRNFQPNTLEHWLKQYGSPLLVYSEYSLHALVTSFQEFCAASGRHTQIAFALKACPNLSILRLFHAYGLLIEVNSAQEYRIALDAGFKPQQIHINGVAKNTELIDLAILKGCRALHLDSVEEIDIIAARVASRGSRLAIQLRICPDIGVALAPGLMTGQLQSPFGVALQDLPMAWQALRRHRKHLILQGLHVHAGSGGDLEAIYPQLIDVMQAALADSIAALPEQALEVNLGGGFISDPQHIFKVKGSESILKQISRLPFNTALMFEPGRFFVEYAADLYCQVAALKCKADLRWVLLDAGYCHLSDRAIVGVRFPLRALRKSKDYSLMRVAGPLCDSVDTYLSSELGINGFNLPTDLQCGEVIEIACAGAYVYSTGNHFAGFCQPAVLLVGIDGQARLIRRAEQYQDLCALELGL